MQERVRFALEWRRRWEAGEGRVNIAELCREFGVSRETGYVWLRRYREAKEDVRVLEARSSRPRRSPTAVEQTMEDFLVEARKAFPTWGPRKLRAYLVERHPQLTLPSASTIGELLRKRGLTTPRKRSRSKTVPRGRPFATCDGPNATWCVDFKGHFRTGDGVWCYPLTILDAHSRYLIRCEVVSQPTGAEVQRVFDSAFSEFGLPAAIRSDNGSPFASTGAGGLTRLSAWWVRLGIRLERIEPGKPQQNGRQERFHRTLKAETASPSERNRRAQQRAFDLFRKQYNEVRPHEALGQKPPVSAYAPSSRRYPRPLLRFDTQPWDAQFVVDKQGFIRLGRSKLLVSSALAGERIEFMPDDHGWTLTFGPVVLGHVSAKDKEKRFRVKRVWNVSAMEEVSGTSSG